MITSRVAKSGAKVKWVQRTGRHPVVMLGAAVLCLSAQGYAEESARSLRSSASVDARVTMDTERAFWVCDYAATTRWVSPEEGALCVAIYEDLKKRKFDGDFRLMLDWWQKNKQAEHSSLAAAGRATGAP